MNKMISSLIFWFFLLLLYLDRSNWRTLMGQVDKLELHLFPRHTSRCYPFRYMLMRLPVVVGGGFFVPLDLLQDTFTSSGWCKVPVVGSLVTRSLKSSRQLVHRLMVVDLAGVQSGDEAILSLFHQQKFECKVLLALLALGVFLVLKWWGSTSQEEEEDVNQESPKDHHQQDLQHSPSPQAPPVRKEDLVDQQTQDSIVKYLQPQDSIVKYLQPQDSMVKDSQTQDSMVKDPLEFELEDVIKANINIIRLAKHEMAIKNKVMLGQGANAAVYPLPECIYPDQTAPLCVKFMIHKKKDFRLPLACREALRMVHLKGIAGVPQLVAVCIDVPGVVMTQHGTLTMYDMVRYRICSDLAMLDAVRQVTVTLQAIHDRGYVHNDIKLNNVSVNKVRGDDIVATLLDFDRLTKISDNIGPRNLLTPEGRKKKEELRQEMYFWMAPEVFHDRNATPASDVFSLCVLLDWVLFSMKDKPDKSTSRVLLSNGKDPNPQARPQLKAITEFLAQEINARKRLNSMDSQPQDSMVKDLQPQDSIVNSAGYWEFNSFP